MASFWRVKILRVVFDQGKQVKWPEVHRHILDNFYDFSKSTLLRKMRTLIVVHYDMSFLETLKEVVI